MCKGERKRNVSDIAYARFKAKNFDTREVSFAILDSNDEFTGKTRSDTMEVPKKKHTEIRPVSGKGKDMRDTKWIKLMNPTNAQEEAQKDLKRVLSLPTLHSRFVDEICGTRL